MSADVDDKPIAELARTTLDGTVYVQLGGTLLVDELDQLALAIQVLERLDRDCSITLYPDRTVIHAPRKL